jgi:hypothetical protein
LKNFFLSFIFLILDIFFLLVKILIFSLYLFLIGFYFYSPIIPISFLEGMEILIDFKIGIREVSDLKISDSRLETSESLSLRLSSEKVERTDS